MSCREQITDCIHRRFMNIEFSAADIIAALHEEGSIYPSSTIRTHVTSYMCANAPQNHGVHYEDIIRIGRARYRRNG